MQEVFTTQWANYYAWNSAYNHRSGTQSSPRTADDLLKMHECRKTKMEEVCSPKKIKEYLANAEKTIKQCFMNGKWKLLLPGKEILEGFRKKYLSDIPSDRFKSQIISEMARQKNLCEELNKLYSFINEH